MFQWFIPSLFGLILSHKPGGYSVAISARGLGTWSQAGCWPGFGLHVPPYMGRDAWCEWEG